MDCTTLLYSLHHFHKLSPLLFPSPPLLVPLQLLQPQPHAIKGLEQQHAQQGSQQGARREDEVTQAHAIDGKEGCQVGTPVWSTTTALFFSPLMVRRGAKWEHMCGAPPPHSFSVQESKGGSIVGRAPRMKLR